MKTQSEIRNLITELEQQRDEHYELANDADTTAGEDALLSIGDDRQTWIDALNWVVGDHK